MLGFESVVSRGHFRSLRRWGGAGREACASHRVAVPVADRQLAIDALLPLLGSNDLVYQQHSGRYRSLAGICLEVADICHVALRPPNSASRARLWAATTFACTTFGFNRPKLVKAALARVVTCHSKRCYLLVRSSLSPRARLVLQQHQHARRRRLCGPRLHCSCHDLYCASATT